MDIRQRQKMRERKRRKRRRIAGFLAIAVILLIIVLAAVLSKGNKTSAPEEPSPTPQVVEQIEPTPAPAPETAEDFVLQMSLDDKIMQMFIITADSLTGVENSTIYGGKTQNAITEKPVGGIVYTSGNIETKTQLASMLSNTAKQYKEENGFSAFIIAEEEGGSVSPVAEKLGDNVGDMSQFKDGENFDGATSAGAKIGKYMKSLGFNMNLAPNLKVSEDARSFGNDAETVSSMAMSFGDGMKNSGIIPVYKTFTGTPLATREELLPFEMAVNNGAKVIMVSAENYSGKPYYASGEVVTDTLCTTLDFDGVIITAPLTSDNTVVSAVMAGCDMLLMPKDLEAAVSELKGAVERGEIGEERINQSVRKIIDLKLSM